MSIPASLPRIERPWTREWFCEGTPAPGGSKRTFIPTRKDGTPVLRANGSIMVNVTDDAGKRNKEWRKIVAWSARQWWHLPPAEGPVQVEFIFFLRRPRCHYGTGRNANVLLPSAPEYHLQKPDGLKLARGTEDALTGIVWKDDCYVVKGPYPEKRWAESDERAGCIVRIRLL